MNIPSDDKQIEKLIETIKKECKWRQNVFGVDVCKGMCLPCDKMIYDGKCDELIKIFGKGE